MKRFRVFKNTKVIAKFDTLLECFEFLRKKDLGMVDYYVDDVEDDIEVDAEDVLTAFLDGEYPKDLQFF